MNCPSRFGVVLLSALLLYGCGGEPERREPAVRDVRVAIGADSAEVRAAIDRENTNYIDALLTGNAELFSKCFTENGAILLPNGRVIQGRDSIFAAIRPVFRTLKMSDGKTTTQNVYLVDEYVYEIGQWNASVGPASGASVRPDSGQYVRIWKRDDRREWKIWRDIVRRWRAAS